MTDLLPGLFALALFRAALRVAGAALRSPFEPGAKADLVFVGVSLARAGEVIDREVVRVRVALVWPGSTDPFVEDFVPVVFEAEDLATCEEADAWISALAHRWEVAGVSVEDALVGRDRFEVSLLRASTLAGLSLDGTDRARRIVWRVREVGDEPASEPDALAFALHLDAARVRPDRFAALLADFEARRVVFPRFLATLADSGETFVVRGTAGENLRIDRSATLERNRR